MDADDLDQAIQTQQAINRVDSFARWALLVCGVYLAFLVFLWTQ